MDELRRRLRFAYVAEEWSRENLGRSLTGPELQGVLRRYHSRSQLFRNDSTSPKEAERVCDLAGGGRHPFDVFLGENQDSGVNDGAVQSSASSSRPISIYEFLMYMGSAQEHHSPHRFTFRGNSEVAA
jgi:hypothetical protein